MTDASAHAHGLIPSPTRPHIPGGGPQTVADVLDRAVAATPAREALVGRHRRYTYGELDAEVNRAATVLTELGIGAGDRMAASLPNDTEIVVAFLAAMRLGAIWVGINRALAPVEKAYMIDDAEVTLFLGDTTTVDQGGCKVVVDASPGPGTEWAERVAAAEPRRPPVIIDPFGPAAIAYTSGTTGFPKGAVHSQHNLLVPGAAGPLLGLADPDGRGGVCLPLTLLNLIVLSPLVVFQAGASCVCMDRVDPLGIAEWVRTERITTFSAVPAILHDLLRHPDVTAEDLATLTRPGVGGADCPESFRQLYQERYGKRVSTGYGLTEAPTAVTIEDPSVPGIPGASGRALPQITIHIRDPEDRPLPAGQVGEVCVGPSTEGPLAGVYTTMLGYWNKPEETATALRGGLLHTGDLGYLDGDGNLFIKDRRSDLIIRGGANVYPAEVERVLYGDDRVAACAVLGIADERLGQRVVAAVQLAPGANATADDLQDACRSQLARYKVPDTVVFVDDFPRTPMNKIKKRELVPLFT